MAATTNCNAFFDILIPAMQSYLEPYFEIVDGITMGTSTLCNAEPCMKHVHCLRHVDPHDYQAILGMWRDIRSLFDNLIFTYPLSAYPKGYKIRIARFWVYTEPEYFTLTIEINYTGCRSVYKLAKQIQNVDISSEH